MQSQLISVMLPAVMLLGCSALDNEKHELIIIGQGQDEWLGIETLIQDPVGDQGVSGIDLLSLSAASQNDWLILHFELAEEIVLQRRNALTLLIDADNDPSTGKQLHGLGVEFKWVFGARGGFVYHGSGDSIAVDQTDFTIRAAPTFSSTDFELAVGLNAEFEETGKLFQNNEVRIAFLDDSPGGDRLPQHGGGVFSLKPSISVSIPFIGLARQDTTHLRILQHNVLEDGILKRQDLFRNIYQEADPDLLLLGEVFETTAAEALELIDNWLPLKQGAWQSIKHQDGSIILSRYPLKMLKRRLSATGDGFLVTLPPPWKGEVLVVHAYAMCCDADSLRQDHCDRIMADIREWRHQSDIQPDTPIILAGDFNLVTWKKHYQTLLAGRITDTLRYGPAFSPDVNGPFRDLDPRSLGRQTDYTWRNESMDFSPGRLDMIFYTGSSLGTGTSFVFDDDGVDEVRLAEWGLRRGDFARAADHRPLVADFYPR